MSSDSLKNTVALVTGATGGIGLALAHRLAAAGAGVYLAGRNAAALEAAQRDLGERAHALACDLDLDGDIEAAAQAIVRRSGRLDVLAHCAGVIGIGPLESMAITELDRHYRINVRGPLLLTQRLLPLLKQAQGQLVFVNSSVGTRTKPEVGAYAASKHALRAIADTLRAELNPAGVRVLSVFPGNTATPMQQRIQQALGKPYHPHAMLQPDDVAAIVLNALQLPRTAEVTDIQIRPLVSTP
jgi:NAD(P)-dependent dehydrogenase (short-subunit alcohol dehydrogenase family)